MFNVWSVFENEMIIIINITSASMVRSRAYTYMTAYMNGWVVLCNSQLLTCGPDPFLHLLGIYIYSLANYLCKI